MLIYISIKEISYCDTENFTVEIDITIDYMTLDDQYDLWKA